ncbi:site-specific integrase [Nodosilinea sp. AN01ver1]|uniref:site-specific integrase n=1 Tax=Nodosilinea sp. AN01ver1 TaxID=3423362 RepID=UPI003D31AFFF
MDFQGRLKQANSRLRTGKVGVAIELAGKRLCLRATLPPRPGSSKIGPYQQRLFLGHHANPAGLKLAEVEAKRVGLLLEAREFDWADYGATGESRTVADWITAFERDYFTRRQRSAKTETTWRDDYMKAFGKLPQGAVLTVDLLRATIEATRPDSRTRKRVCDCLGRLATFAGLEADFRSLKGHYSTTTTEVREVPPDGLIAETWATIPNPAWQCAYGLMAAYGLRNHELFYLDFSKMPVLLVLDGSKTDFHRVYPLYPEWVEQFGLNCPQLPPCTGANNSALGHRVTRAFERYAVPFNPYDLRHAWAVRSLEFGLPVELAAQQMGHSVKVHCDTYHRWISEEVHDRAYRVLMARADRPQPPSGMA